MDSSQKAVSDGMVVAIDYTVRLADGTLVDTTDGDEPLTYLHGVGEIIPGLERALGGMHVGENKEVTLEPADAYGPFDPDQLEEVSLDLFEEDLDLEPGMELELEDEESGEIYLATVSEIGDDHVLLDFNHPLAGETLLFSVKVLALRPATKEELEHQHAHTTHHH